MLRRMRSRSAFTLIELLVVIAIIGILSSVVLASLSTARTKSRDARRISDVGQMQTALELYFDANQQYPAQAVAATVALNSAAMIAALQTNGFIPQIPTTPAGATSYQYMGLILLAECNGAAVCTSYDINAQLERFDTTALTADADILTTGTAISGLSVSCVVGVAGSPAQPGGGAAGERCYDLKP